MTADWPDDNPSAHRALAIYAQRVPLARNSGVVASATNQALMPGTAVTLANITPLDSTSWQLTVSANLGTNLGTLPFWNAIMQWFDSTISATTRIKRLYGVSGNGNMNQLTTAGFGPVRGDRLNLALTNVDPAQILTYSFSLILASHVYARDEWRQGAYSGVSPNGFAYPSNDLQGDLLAFINPTLTPGSTQSRLMAVYWGKVHVHLDNPAAGNSCQLTITDPVGDVATGITYLNQTVLTGTTFDQDLFFPARPMLVSVKNLGGAGNIQPAFTATLAEY